MSAGSNAPTIIKRKKVVAGGGHHGGAWKVAMFNGPLNEVLCTMLVHESAGSLRVEASF
jgi:hypothetical protein